MRFDFKLPVCPTCGSRVIKYEIEVDEKIETFEFVCGVRYYRGWQSVFHDRQEFPNYRYDRYSEDSTFTKSGICTNAEEVVRRLREEKTR